MTSTHTRFPALAPYIVERMCAREAELTAWIERDVSLLAAAADSFEADAITADLRAMREELKEIREAVRVMERFR